MRKAQTSTEYLIILAVVIIIALVAINTLGGFPGIGSNNNKKVSDFKLSSDTIGIESYSIGVNSSLFKIKNNYFDTITVTEFRVNQQSNLTCNSSNTIPALPVVLNVGQSMIINCSIVNSSSYTITTKQTPVIGISYTDNLGATRTAGNVGSYGSTSLVENIGASGCVAVGGNITVVNGYKIHTFTNIGNSVFNITGSNCDVEVLLVAGGGSGGGGGAPGGGGGAGGLIYLSSLIVTGETNVTVGIGGSNGNNGGDSFFGTNQAFGGGNGRDYGHIKDASQGGSGGGGGYFNSVGGLGIAGQGYSGGIANGWASPLESGGGGGAGGLGPNYVVGYSGVGGIGKQYSQFSTVGGFPAGWFAGGGGGTSTAQGAINGSGGLGGGGSGAVVHDSLGSNGVVNTGGGGGGSHNNLGGSGGSGIVIVRYSLTGSQTLNCAVQQTNCSGTEYWNCSNGNWVNNGNVSGRCGYVAPIVPCSAVGGNITVLNGYKIHTFLSNSTFNVSSSSCVAEVLVVGGGGAGGGNGAPGGGGGAGGLIYNNSYTLTLGNYSILVGNGGLPGNNGDNSTFGSLIAVGGGHGAMYSGSRTTGGSGAGGGYSTSAGAAGTAGQGNMGGNGLGTSSMPLGAGGGGGAGAVGQAATANPSGKSGDGGIGLNYSISGVNTYYAGGGGAGVTAQGSSQGFGGLGGGGNGTSIQNVAGGNAIANTGGGGGGSHNAAGGSGGSGIVIVRYLIS